MNTNKHISTGSAFRKSHADGHVPQNSSPLPHRLPLHHDSSVSDQSNSTFIWAEALIKHVLKNRSKLVLPWPWYQRKPCRDDPPLVYYNKTTTDRCGIYQQIIVVWTILIGERKPTISLSARFCWRVVWAGVRDRCVWSSRPPLTAPLRLLSKTPNSLKQDPQIR